MDRRSIWFFTFLVTTIVVIILFVTGSSLLLVALDNNDSIPLGTFITWLGMVSLPMTIYSGIKELRNPTRKLSKILSPLLKFIIVLGILWVPLAYLLAGNLSFTFTEKTSFQGGQMAMKTFWILSYGIGIGALSVLVIYWISLFFTKK